MDPQPKMAGASHTINAADPWTVKSRVRRNSGPNTVQGAGYILWISGFVSKLFRLQGYAVDIESPA